MVEKILFVDDEAAVLQGYKRLFRSDFDIDTAVGGRGGLINIASKGPYAVVVSDMRMPDMDGVEFLCEVKKLSPDSIRIMLSGHADLSSAIAAVNEGNIFRFLTKPCDKDTLGKVLTGAILQYRLVVAERELLEQTLKGSVLVLSEVLSLVNPAAFGRAMRIRRYMSHVVTRLGLTRPWRFEVAAMMSQLGCVALPPETIQAVFSGQRLPPEEQARYDSHPAIAGTLLENIPRLEPIAWMIAHQNRPTSVDSDIADREMADMRLGAELLRATIAFDDLISKGKSRTEAANQVLIQHRYLDQKVMYALIELEPEAREMETCLCDVEELATGTILDQDIHDTNGTLVVVRGQEVTPTLILKLKNFCSKGTVAGQVRVLLMKEQEDLPFQTAAKA
jgi:FixJ family two-component response regulator